MTKFDKNYWEQRYLDKETGWDIGYPSTPLVNFFNTLRDKSIRILIPGAGNAYEFQWLYNNGFKNIFVVDIAPSAIASIKMRMPKLSEQHFFCEDFFEHHGEYDLIIEQTFFCALFPGFRQKYVQTCHKLLGKKGKLVGLFFDFPLNEGPPFGGSESEYRQLFQSFFQIDRLERATDSIPPRMGTELFFEMTKNN